ncbi:ADP-ribosylglycohydrolase family protein [Limnoglobus roseus]|uniref:Dinitrogenase reductase n=1 Tax=Limnoglobus roseus TaxID=2598579 RepID=A0A5C1A5X4_9BACT|nr:ADP-ribosylglycohydrolase family protein [Limnoglobus roseus]QEL13755.1 dinitrogenase reductase [Limnoglobus roseus]
MTNEDAVLGCLLGQAVGDAMGLPMEGLSRRRGPRLYPRHDRMQFFFGYGMGSDDTDHACMTALALPPRYDERPDYANAFRRDLAWRLRWWFLGVPVGIGKATLKACVKLWLGFPSTKSGVFSAGNGPAMRATVLGAWAENDEELKVLVRASTRITHTDPKAEYGALAVALAANVAATTRDGPAPSAEVLTARLDELLPHDTAADELRGLLRQVVEGIAEGLTVEAFAEKLGLTRGVSGYIYHTVPVALFAFFRHADDYRTAIPAVIRCGGDTDTVAAITGGLIGTRVGKPGIPAEWLASYRDWPWSVGRIERIVKKEMLDFTPGPQMFPFYKFWLPFQIVLLLLMCVAMLLAYPVLVLLRVTTRLLRNFLFFLVVLGHIVRRMLPPY